MIVGNPHLFFWGGEIVRHHVNLVLVSYWHLISLPTMVKFAFLTSALLLGSALAREMPVNEEVHARLYATGEIMDKIMMEKEQTWAKYRAAGYFADGRWPSHNYFKECGDDGTLQLGKGPNGTHKCMNLDMTGHLSHQDLGSTNDTGGRMGSSIWGITLEGHEYVMIGQQDGMAFAEVVGKGWWNYIPIVGKKEGTLDYLGRLPPQSEASWWREIKTYKHYAIVGSEAVGHGVQIFDLRKLLDIRPGWNPLSRATKVFSTQTDLTGWFNELPIGRSHNVVIAADSDHIIAVGAQPRASECKSGLIFVDVSDPSNPKKTGCASEDGYVHDAQCLIYKGPDNKYVGREICYGYNEDSLTIYDITSKSAPKIISRTSYEGANYTHQGWVLDPENQEFLLMDDEYDEARRKGPAADGHATTYIWNITSLENPIQSGLYKSSAISIDHNQYINNGYSYQSNYASGLRILDVSSVPKDPTGKGVQEVAYFDVFPEDDFSPMTEFVGTWGSYGYFKSGHIVVNTIDRGVFVLKRSKKIKGNLRAEF